MDQEEDHQRSCEDVMRLSDINKETERLQKAKRIRDAKKGDKKLNRKRGK